MAILQDLAAPGSWLLIQKASWGQSSHIQGKVGGSNNSKRVLGRGGYSPVQLGSVVALGGGVLHSSPCPSGLPLGGSVGIRDRH